MAPRRKAAFAVLSALALVSACEVASAAEPVAETAKPVYTLVVESDDTDTLSYEAVAARLSTDLGSQVARTGEPTGAAITVRYRSKDHELFVRAAHGSGPTLERTVRTEGDASAIQREAILLAGNLARNEARELIEELAHRPPKEPLPSSPAKPAAPPAKEPENEENVYASLAIAYPLATNAGKPNATSFFDLSILYGRVGRVVGAQVGGIVSHASRDVEGAQIAGFGAIASGAVVGARASGAFNWGHSTVDGADLAGALNVARGDVTGARAAGGFNLTLGKLKGADLAGGFNYAGGGVEGVQAAPLNIASDVDGLQLGVVNIGRKVKGTQIGVLNIAEEVDGLALGVVSISRNSIHPIAWTSNLGYLNAGVKFTTKYVYTVAAVSLHTHETDFDDFASTAALGGHVPLDAMLSGLDVEIESAFTSVTPTGGARSNDDNNMWLSGRLVPGYSFAKHLRVFAGMGARFPLRVEVGRSVVRPEAVAGVQF